MTDKEILDEVYRMVSNGYVADVQDDVVRFIEQEWQRRDEQELVDQYNRNRKPEDQIKDVDELAGRLMQGIKPPPSWVKEEWSHSYPSVGVKEIERHRGLEIGPDGTVTNLK
tara:strand:+ start:168 stop:503 length:336 start_codon:yes stop_codon:yes gene_type:complete